MRRPVSARPIQCRAINLRQAVKLETVSVHLRASVPRAFHVVGKSRASAIRASAIDLGTKCGCSVVPGDTIFEVSHAFKRGVPSTFELACHQPLCWINDLIAARRQRGFVARFLEFPAQRLPDIGVDPLGLIGGLQGGLHRMLRYSLNDLSSDRTIDPNADA